MIYFMKRKSTSHISMEEMVGVLNEMDGVSVLAQGGGILKIDADDKAAADLRENAAGWIVEEEKFTLAPHMIPPPGLV